MKRMLVLLSLLCVLGYAFAVAQEMLWLRMMLRPLPHLLLCVALLSIQKSWSRWGALLALLWAACAEAMWAWWPDALVWRWTLWSAQCLCMTVVVWRRSRRWELARVMPFWGYAMGCFSILYSAYLHVAPQRLWMGGVYLLCLSAYSWRASVLFTEEQLSKACVWMAVCAGLCLWARETLWGVSMFVQPLPWMPQVTMFWSWSASVFLVLAVLDWNA
ncbi:MAG: hypothetical protein AAGJ35_01590 [Myxococcota bacterium]